MTQVRLPTVLRPSAGGNSSLEVNGESIREILEAISSKYPQFASQVLTEDGELHKFVNVYLNDDDVRYLEKLETKVGTDDRISILPAVAGGTD